MIILNIIAIAAAIALIALVLLQMQGSGLSTAFGGTGEFYRSKRSVEKLLMWATVVTTVIFAIASLLLLLPLK
ncbi:MAG TPA: preprotein translocase subunit SecG [Patescibacteria group bacterium]|jgi:protein translocase SecG subunit|nr:preprotein translocase subunit SecG [Patescibacteria group bacterium]